MLTQKQKDDFARDGVIVVPDVVTDALSDVRAEYAAIMDRLWAEWVAEGRVAAGPETFEDRIVAAYRAGCEYFQPMDISLPLDDIQPDVPFHAGSAVFAMMTHPRLHPLRACQTKHMHAPH